MIGSPRGRGRLVLLALAWFLAVLALAGPSLERQPQPVGQGDDALVLVLDLSLSMYAEDLPPSRLLRARLKIEDVLARRRDGRTALRLRAPSCSLPTTGDFYSGSAIASANLIGAISLYGRRTTPNSWCYENSKLKLKREPMPFLTKSSRRRRHGSGKASKPDVRVMRVESEP